METSNGYVVIFGGELNHRMIGLVNGLVNSHRFQGSLHAARRYGPIFYETIPAVRRQVSSCLIVRCRWGL